jgi:hypothetical protein
MVNAFDDDRGRFLRSEKDARPHWETDERPMFPFASWAMGSLTPLGKSGYNGKMVPMVPDAGGGAGAGTLHDILAGARGATARMLDKVPGTQSGWHGLDPKETGKEVWNLDEINHGAAGAANFMLTGGLAGNIGKRPQAGVMSSSGAQPPSPQGIRAYHGSPHEFDKFDLSKIGSGKGANNYGSGIYLAESEAAAQAYKPPNGRMYEVNVKADPADLLAWDKPLSSQSNKVRDAISNYASSVKSDVGGWNSSKPVSYYLPSGNGRAITMADTLRNAGVPGIRYSDGVEGGSNYVVFDDKLIDITRMYSNPRQGAIAPLAENAAKNLSRDVDGLGYYSAALEAITPAMREQARKGLPLFMNPVTGAIVPLTGNAFDER